MSQRALLDIFYRNSVYTLVRRVCCQPLPYGILRNVVLWNRLTEIGAVGNLYEIADLPNASFLYRSKRNPAIKRKVSSVKGGQRHLPYIVPFGCALRRISLRPFPVGIEVTASVCPLMELRTAVGVPEVRQDIAAVLIELQLYVLQLFLKISPFRIHSKREIDCALTVLQLQRCFLYLQACTREGDQLGHALFGAHTRIVHRFAVIPEIGTEDTPVFGSDFLVEDLAEALGNLSGYQYILTCSGIECIQSGYGRILISGAYFLRACGLTVNCSVVCLAVLSVAVLFLRARICCGSLVHVCAGSGYGLQ